MVTLLARFFIKDERSTPIQYVRQVYGMLSGSVGIALNIFLFIGKFIAGTISHSIAITADAFNNLSDAGSSFITLIGFKLASAKPDPEHPFGHGRMEYLSGLVVSCSIIIMAVELFRNSFDKILHPVETSFSLLSIVILLISILVKIYMFYYNNKIGKRIDSAAMRATAVDSLSDTIATTMVLLSTLIALWTDLQIDGYCGVLVSLFIFYAGISAAKETLNPLLGQPPESEFVDQIQELVMSDSTVIGIHDLVVHDYGPGRLMISLHAEVPASGDILAMHDVIDQLESRLRQELNCEAVIHMDPVVTDDEDVRNLKLQITDLLTELDPIITMHDFRVVKGPTHTNLIFDIVVPFKFSVKDNDLSSIIQEMVHGKIGANFYTVVQIDHSYVK